MSCANNLRQLGLALQDFENTNKSYPSSLRPTPVDPNGLFNGWSALAQLLPYLEQGNLFQGIDFEQPYSVQPHISKIRVAAYTCPAEIRSRQKYDASGNAVHFPLNYVANQGPWFVFDPVKREGSRGAFRHYLPLRAAEITDGLSNTLGFAECKAYTSYLRNASVTNLNQPMPVSVADLCALGGDLKVDGAHVEWVDGKAHETGFTTAFPPNARATCAASGEQAVINWISQSEGRSATVPTFAAFTSRSYHPSGVQAVMMDGSVHLFSNSIDKALWQALSTREGGETTTLP